MTGGLLFLLRRNAWGRLRLVGRRMRTWKGAISFGAAFLFVAGMVALQLWSLTFPETAVDAAAATGDLRAAGPPVLLLLALLTFLTGRALYFTPAEVDFLFPAPVSRRGLLAYNVLSRLGIQVLSGLWTALFVVRWAPHPALGAAAVVLAFVFMYVTAQALGLAASAAEAWLPAPVRRALRVLAIAAVLLVAVRAAGDAVPGSGLGGIVQSIARSDAIVAASVVARPFVELFLAATAGAALLWAALCLAIVAVEVGLLMAFDVAFTERSLAVSRKLHERLRRTRAGGGGFAAGAGRLRLRVPPPPFLGRAAPLAARQLTELARTPRAMVPALVMAGVWLAAMLAGVRDGEGDWQVAVGMGVLFPVVFTAHLPFDFRRDVDRMPLLRSLPLSPTAVAVGQIFPVALLFALVQMAMVGTVALAAGLPPLWLLVIFLALPPFSWAALAVDNGLFLLMPYRVSTEGEPNFQFMGKVMLAMLLKLVVLAVLAGLALLVAWAAYALTAASTVAAVLAGSLALAAGCVPLTWLVGRAFAAFEPRDVPV